jgi:hypothetical protein
MVFSEVSRRAKSHGVKAKAAAIRYEALRSPSPEGKSDALPELFELPGHQGPDLLAWSAAAVPPLQNLY